MDPHEKVSMDAEQIMSGSWYFEFIVKETLKNLLERLNSISHPLAHVYIYVYIYIYIYYIHILTKEPILGTCSWKDEHGSLGLNVKTTFFTWTGTGLDLVWNHMEII